MQYCLPQNTKRRIICHGVVKTRAFTTFLIDVTKGLNIYNAHYASVDAFYCDGRTFDRGFCGALSARLAQHGQTKFPGHLCNHLRAFYRPDGFISVEFFKSGTAKHLYVARSGLDGLSDPVSTAVSGADGSLYHLAFDG